MDNALSCWAAVQASAWPPRRRPFARGARVVIASSRKDRIEAALVTLPTGSEGHVLDLADSDATRALFARLGSFDHLVFTAGETLQLGSLATTDLDAARRFFALRYWGAYCAAKYGSSSIGKGGSIVFTGCGQNVIFND